jgi:hypothetical protein
MKPKRKPEGRKKKKKKKKKTGIDSQGKRKKKKKKERAQIREKSAGTRTSVKRKKKKKGFCSLIKRGAAHVKGERAHETRKRQKNWSAETEKKKKQKTAQPQKKKKKFSRLGVPDSRGEKRQCLYAGDLSLIFKFSLFHVFLFIFCHVL